MPCLLVLPYHVGPGAQGAPLLAPWALLYSPRRLRRALTTGLRREVLISQAFALAHSSKDSNMETINENTITASRVADAARLLFLPTYFGRDMMKVETAIFRHMSELCESYHGGFWHFYELSNGGAFMAPASDAPLAIGVYGNHYSGTMSAEAAGITATLFALSHLTFNYPDADVLIERFHQLRDFAADHAESSAIFAAID